MEFKQVKTDFETARFFPDAKDWEKIYIPELLVGKISTSGVKYYTGGGTIENVNYHVTLIGVHVIDSFTTTNLEEAIKLCDEKAELLLSKLGIVLTK